MFCLCSPLRVLVSGLTFRSLIHFEFIFVYDVRKGEGEGGTIWGNGTETCIISYKKQIASPGSMQDAWGWCTGMTRRDGTWREVGGGFSMGNMCMPAPNSR